MKYSWINKSDNRELLVFFNGWAMDYKPFAHIATDSFDVIEICDYTTPNLDIDLHKIASRYTKTTLIAWSLGVWSAANILQQQNFTPDIAIAVNGTVSPIDSEFGIAPDVFQATIDNFSDTANTNFNRRMCKNKNNFKFFIDNHPARSADEQKLELISLQSQIAKKDLANCDLFDIAIIGTQDKIIPAKNQLNFWNNKSVKVIKTKQPHYLFADIKSWQEIINISQSSVNIKPDKELIKQRFARSIKTYPANASVQSDIAETLLEKLIESAGNNFSEIIEVGCGTGLLTSQLIKKITYDKIYLNDMVQQCHFVSEQTTNSRFICGDIERIENINNIPENAKADLIISNATFQWLHETDKTFEKFANWLDDNGILAFSTFGPDNLKEISQLTGVSLGYHCADELKNLLSKNYSVLSYCEKKHHCKFPDPQSVLKHLKQTGVTATSNTQWSKENLQQFIKDYQLNFAQDDGVILTYHSMVVIAQVK